ncbi:MAG: hypothetical protein KC619_22850 [Myxococcales bacterium]|nr:hypothetical protein [Myxococcales bacterium]
MALIRFEETARTPYAEGRVFGDVGAFVQVDGVAHFAVDPTHPANRAIVDLALAPRDADGRVRFEADLSVVMPVEPDRGAGRLLVELPNRGRRRVVPVLDRAPADALGLVVVAGLLEREGVAAEEEPVAGSVVREGRQDALDAAPHAGRVAEHEAEAVGQLREEEVLRRGGEPGVEQVGGAGALVLAPRAERPHEGDVPRRRGREPIEDRVDLRQDVSPPELAEREPPQRERGDQVGLEGQGLRERLPAGGAMGQHPAHRAREGRACFLGARRDGARPARDRRRRHRPRLVATGPDVTPAP